MNEKSFISTPERRKIWEKEPVQVVNAVKTIAQETGLNLPKPLQSIEGSELTPEQVVDIDDKPLLNPDCPNIMFGRPHAGEFVPKDLYDRSNPEAHKSLVGLDRATGVIFKGDQIPSVGTKISRLIVDPNRAPSMEVEPENPAALGKVLWRQGLFEEEIYQEGQEPTEDEVKDLIERFYLPYYNAVMAMVGSLTDRRKKEGGVSSERILMIDGHSFPISKELKNIWDRYGVDKPTELPLFIIGDRDGQACDQDIRETFVAALEKNFQALSESEMAALLGDDISREIVGLNKPFKGVHNVQFYGQREQGVNSLQLELNESMFVDEKDGSYFDASYKEKNIEIVRRLIAKTCLDINHLLKDK